jgi:hypothetical protein
MSDPIQKVTWREMVEPEDDFQTWMVIISSVVEMPHDFNRFLGSIDRLLCVIRETEQLPDPLQESTAQFLTFLMADLLPKVQGLMVVDEQCL